MGSFPIRVLFSMAVGFFACSGKAFAQTFVLGMVAGMLLSEGEGSNQMREVFSRAGLTGIPFRCLMVGTEEEYFDCRTPSMIAELQQARYRGGQYVHCALVWDSEVFRSQRWYPRDATSIERMCNVRWHIELEIRALKALEATAQTSTPRP